jgi:hypothetical protein
VNRIPTSTRVIATAAVLFTGGAILTPGGAAAAQAAPPSLSQGIELQTIALTTGSAARTEAAPAVVARPTRPFSLLGATWTDPAVALAGTVEVRTRSVAGGRWTAWQALESDGPDAADPGTEPGQVRGSTDPLWVGESNGVEARLVTPDGRTAPRPAGLRLDLVNPDEAAAPIGRPAHGMALQPRPVPKMISRVGWDADESIVKLPPEYTSDVQVMFVHHTATSNGYACSQSASIVRGIEIYHVRSRGWNDIGYNFLVDKCGTLFEGRRGGVGRSVLGAHTLGFNSHSSAIAVIGNYSGVRAPARVIRVIAQVAAYKIGAFGHNPIGRVVLTSSGGDRYPSGARVTLNRISGHRDVGATACPGTDLYGQLGTIRTLAGAGPAAFRFLKLTGAVWVDDHFLTHGAVRPLWTLNTPSAMIDRFDVAVDGKRVASLPGSNRTTTLRLATGTHTVAVRAIHLSGRSHTITLRVVSDPE